MRFSASINISGHKSTPLKHLVVINAKMGSAAVPVVTTRGRLVVRFSLRVCHPHVLRYVPHGYEQFIFSFTFKRTLMVNSKVLKRTVNCEF